MAFPLLGLVSAVVGPLFKVIDDAVGDKDLAVKLKQEVAMSVENNAHEIATKAGDIVLGEIKGESWMQRNWRPCLMFLIMGLLVFNGVAVPLVEAIWNINLPILEAWHAIPEQMWNLLTIGMGGYIVGRTGEKMIETWKGK